VVGFRLAGTVMDTPNQHQTRGAESCWAALIAIDREQTIRPVAVTGRNRFQTPQYRPSSALSTRTRDAVVTGCTS